MTTTGYPYEHTINVIYRDIDAMRHVNNTVYFTYMETTRVQFLMDKMGVTHIDEIPTVVAETTCSFKSPAFLGETLTVGMGVSRFGNKSFDIIYRIQAQDGRLVATAKSVHVIFDQATQKSAPIPEDFRAKIEALQKDWTPE